MFEIGFEITGNPGNFVFEIGVEGFRGIYQNDIVFRRLILGIVIGKSGEACEHQDKTQDEEKSRRQSCL